MSSINSGCLPSAGFVDETAVIDDDAIAYRTAALIRSSTVKIVGVFVGAELSIPAHRVSATIYCQGVVGGRSVLGIGGIEILMTAIKTVVFIQNQLNAGDIARIVPISKTVMNLILRIGNPGS